MISEEAREARNAYKREWAKKNQEKIRAQQQRYWEKEALKNSAPERKERKTYSDEEKAIFISSGETSGHKGCKMPRINMAFDPDLYDYVRTMATVRGETMTAFVNHVLRESMRQNKTTYSKAIAFRKSL